MRLLLVVVVGGIALAAPAHALTGKTLRVDRPSRGAGAKITHVRVVVGIVRHRMRATVLTDTRCDPDSMGVSHCLNTMRLANGRTITVVHDHRMRDMPCLDPGEHVVLTP